MLYWITAIFSNIIIYSFLFSFYNRINSLEEQLHDQKASAQSAVKEESQKYRKELVCLLYSLILCIFVFFNKEKTCLSNLLSIFKVIKYFCYAAVFLRIWSLAVVQTRNGIEWYLSAKRSFFRFLQRTDLLL